MKYFIDCEFYEGWRKPISWLPGIGFNKPSYVVDLISIAVISEDDREYEAVNKNFSRWNDDKWLKDNVKPRLPKKWLPISEVVGYAGLVSSYHDWSLMKHRPQMNPLYKSLKEIGQELLDFIDDEAPEFVVWYGLTDIMCLRIALGGFFKWPKHFGPHYYKELKEAENIAIDLYYDYKKPDLLHFNENKKDWFRSIMGYPVNKSRHNCLADAEWNRDLCIFLDKILEECMER